MKRVNNLMIKICELGNLYLAYYKANKGKAFDAAAINYSNNLHRNIILLQEQLLSGRVSVGNYHYFTIYDPKVRLICAADFSERVLHHAIMNVCHDYFEKQLIFDTYATRIDKGTYAALDRARTAMKKYQYVVKLDVRKYFDSILHEVLLKKLNHIFKDKKLLDIFQQIIASYETKPNQGIPIGNLSSQYFANYYLSELDHFAKEVLKIKSYFRYMDDILFFGNDKKNIQYQISMLNEKAKSDFLLFKPAIFVPCKQGIIFLGYKLYPDKIKLSRASKKRFKNKLNVMNKQLIRNYNNEKDVQSKVISLLSFVKYAYTKKMRKAII
ncbi:MAG: RNA-directed DNA polymerase [Paludibacter sp.]|nr:RNA-directed DNA polymerase [Paludibacter sp.]